MSENISDGDKTRDTPNSGKQGMVEREVSRGLGWLGDGYWGGHLDGMSTGCYVICWQIVMQHVGKLNSKKNKTKQNKKPFK